MLPSYYYAYSSIYDYLPFFRLRTATDPDGVPINILIPIGDDVVSLHVLIRSVNLLSGSCRLLISVLLVILIPRLLLL